MNVSARLWLDFVGFDGMGLGNPAKVTRNITITNNFWRENARSHPELHVSVGLG